MDTFGSHDDEEFCKNALHKSHTRNYARRRRAANERKKINENEMNFAKR